MRASRSDEIAERSGGLEGTLRVLSGLFALQDLILLVYLSIMGLEVWLAPVTAGGPRPDGPARVIYLSMTALILGCFVARGLPDLSLRFRSIFYRVIIVGVLISNYLTLHDLLVLVRPDAVDEVLVRLDVRIFGVEPALWLERFNQRPIVEWFAFFYFSYFFIAAFYMIKVVWLSHPGRGTAEFAIGTALVFAIGQIGYTAVPGYGPIHHLRGTFHADVNGGFFWGLVWNTVQAGGAMKDIFPSLHTAVPLWFALFARHRAKVDPFWRWPARITAFFSFNIIISTMLLRWHYGIDVLAGLVLGSSAGLLTPRLAAREAAFRKAIGHRGPWSFAKPLSR